MKNNASGLLFNYIVDRDAYNLYLLSVEFE